MHAVWGAVEVAVTARAHICETEGRVLGAHAVWGAGAGVLGWGVHICKIEGRVRVDAGGAGLGCC